MSETSAMACFRDLRTFMKKRLPHHYSNLFSKLMTGQLLVVIVLKMRFDDEGITIEKRYEKREYPPLGHNRASSTSHEVNSSLDKEKYQLSTKSEKITIPSKEVANQSYGLLSNERLIGLVSFSGTHPAVELEVPSYEATTSSGIALAIDS
ncbi:hypothetical protein Tco_0289667 [Tanacetum coccineum]